MSLRFIDNHCHLEAGDAGRAQIEEAQATGVLRFIDVGTDTARSVQSVQAAGAYPGVVFATVGIHPHDATEGIAGIVDLAQAPNVVAIGECGLDYHYDHSPRERQRSVFAQQIALAHEHDLPLVIHTREAWDDTFAILDSEGVPNRTVFHCFTGGPDEARKSLERGGVLSFSGIVTFKNADPLRAALASCATTEVMVETDAPFLTPEPHRGTPNVPANLPIIAARMAGVLGVSLEDLAAQMWETAHEFYRLPHLPD